MNTCPMSTVLKIPSFQSDEGALAIIDGPPNLISGRRLAFQLSAPCLQRNPQARGLFFFAIFPLLSQGRGRILGSLLSG